MRCGYKRLGTVTCAAARDAKGTVLCKPPAGKAVSQHGKQHGVEDSSYRSTLELFNQFSILLLQLLVQGLYLRLLGFELLLKLL